MIIVTGHRKDFGLLDYFDPKVLVCLYDLFVILCWKSEVL